MRRYKKTSLIKYEKQKKKNTVGRIHKKNKNTSMSCNKIQVWLLKQQDK